MICLLSEFGLNVWIGLCDWCVIGFNDGKVDSIVEFVVCGDSGVLEGFWEVVGCVDICLSFGSIVFEKNCCIFVINLRFLCICGYVN